MAFSRNPILLSVVTSSMVAFSVYDITDDDDIGNLLYTGHGEDVFTANLAELVDTLFPDMPVAVGLGPFTDISSFGLLRRVRIIVENQEGDTSQHELKVLRGGTALARYRELRQQGTDVFQSRFLNYRGNFFITARSESHVISMGERELMPLPFIVPEGFCIRECHTRLAYQAGDVPPVGAYALLHVDRLRRWFFDNHQLLPALFCVEVGGVPACHIAVSEGRPEPWCPVVRWLDAYGAWCRLQLAAQAVAQRKLHQQDSDYSHYLQISDSFELRTPRRHVDTRYSVSSGPLTANGMALIADMLASDQVFLALPGAAQELRVIPDVDDYKSLTRQVAPEGVELSFQLTESETNPSLPVTAVGAEPPVIHSRQFDIPFN